MTVVSPGSSFDLNFVPSCAFKELANATLTNTNLNKEIALTKGTEIEYYDNDYYFGATITQDVLEGEFYTIVIVDTDGEETYRGRVFVTAQTNYTINDGNYTERSTSNEYLTR